MRSETEIKQAGGLNSSVSDTHDKTALIGSTVEKSVDATLWKLVLGQIGLHDLTPALAAFWTLGHASGIASCRAQIARLENEADRLYVQAFNPKDRAKLIRERMDAAAADYWEEFSRLGGDL
ncbi:MAG TPA: hypothetical protein VIJ18_18175 [Microbacteriaceae bacterium]